MNDSPDQQKAISAEKIPVLNSSAPVEPVDSAKSGVEDRQVLQRHIAILEMALESCGHGMMITDDQGVMVFHNQNLLRLLGMTGTLVEGTGWQEAFIRRA